LFLRGAGQIGEPAIIERERGLRMVRPVRPKKKGVKGQVENGSHPLQQKIRGRVFRCWHQVTYGNAPLSTRSAGGGWALGRDKL